LPHIFVFSADEGLFLFLFWSCPGAVVGRSAAITRLASCACLDITLVFPAMIVPLIRALVEVFVPLLPLNWGSEVVSGPPGVW
jgi:hypothetical protein